jgi:hypothetical protein
MNPTVTMREALDDPALLGKALDGDSWQAWRVMLIALMGEPLTPAEMSIFTKFTGRKKAPQVMAKEFWAIVGRRGGKSRAMAVLAVFIACLCQHPKLVHGETGVVLVIAPDIRQSRVILQYAIGAIEDSPLLQHDIAGRTADSVTLKNGIRIEVRSSSFRRIRGITAVATMCDEVAFWQSDDSVNPDVEILNAARPALATTGGPLICISSPHARRGSLWEAYRSDFGPDGDPLILVAHGASTDFNPSLDQSIVDRALEKDQAAASAEYLATFRTDIEGFITRESVEACINVGVRERPHERKNAYVCFIDPSGGSSDSFTLAIAHAEGKTQVLDVVRSRRPPFSPEAVVAEYVELMKKYRISSCLGDRYAGEWVAESFRKLGINLEPAKKSKSEIYQDFLPLVNSGGCALLDHDKMVSEFVMLERRTARGGKDSIDHPRGCHDDIANAVAGVLVSAFITPGIRGFDKKLEYREIGIY